MGGAIIGALAKKYKNISVTDKNAAFGKSFAEKNNCTFVEKNADVIKDSKYIFIAVKPQFLDEVFSEISSSITENQVVISMAAGVKIEKLNNFAPKARFIRIMPNVCASILESMISICANSNITAQELNETKELLSECGIVEEVPEKLMDCVTAVSGSGPAFVFMFLEAMADAAVLCGMPRNQAYIYAAQTIKGSADLVLKTQDHPAKLKDSVCSPGGTTIEGVAALEESGLRNSVIKAVNVAYKKSISLGKK
jgi:pyrroline-5-carboxylate reductase